MCVSVCVCHGCHCCCCTAWPGFDCAWLLLLQEREELLLRNKKEMDALFDKRRTMEAKFVEDRLARESSYQEEVRACPAQLRFNTSSRQLGGWHPVQFMGAETTCVLAAASSASTKRNGRLLSRARLACGCARPFIERSLSLSHCGNFVVSAPLALLLLFERIQQPQRCEITTVHHYWHANFVQTYSLCDSQIDEMQAKDAEDFNKLKIRLETDIQVLQQQLQHMQATYLLNTEKLDYNFRVLTEKYVWTVPDVWNRAQFACGHAYRDGENRTTQIQQKRKLTKLREAQAAIMQRYARVMKLLFSSRDSSVRNKNVLCGVPLVYVALACSC